MQAARWPQALMLRTAGTWASGSLSSVLSVGSNRLNAGGGQYLSRRGFPLWSRRVQPPAGSSLRVFGVGVDGTTTGTGLSKRSFKCQSSPSTTEGGKAAGITEELSVFSKFIDEQLLRILNEKTEDPVRQTVLMTDGTDTRPYRLHWPSPSLIFDVSPVGAFNATSVKQIEKGLKVPRSCLLQHVSVDLVLEDKGDDVVDNFLRKGYRGDAPSVWVIEMPRAQLSELFFKEILAIASSLIMKGSTFLGVVPSRWGGSSEVDPIARLRSLVAGQGFEVKVLSYEELTANSPLGSCGAPLASRPTFPLAFVANQLRLSAAQVEYIQMQIALAEEIDEDGFEDSW